MRLLRGAVPAALIAVAGCSLGGPQLPATVTVAGPDTPPATSTVTTPPIAYRAVVGRNGVVVHPAPGSAATYRLSDQTPLHSQRVLLVERILGAWLQVDLPTRPNGSTGWIRAAGVQLEPLYASITVSLSSRRIVVDLPRRTVAGEVAIGSSENPTPPGRYFVSDTINPSDPNGIDGSLLLALNGHSRSVREFPGGVGQIAIHGTDQPDLLGRRVANGCVRVPDSVIPALRSVRLGTPVTILP